MSNPDEPQSQPELNTTETNVLVAVNGAFAPDTSVSAAASGNAAASSTSTATTTPSRHSPSTYVKNSTPSSAPRGGTSRGTAASISTSKVSSRPSTNAPKKPLVPRVARLAEQRQKSAKSPSSSPGGGSDSNATSPAERKQTRKAAPLVPRVARLAAEKKKTPSDEEKTKSDASKRPPGKRVPLVPRCAQGFSPSSTVRADPELLDKVKQTKEGGGGSGGASTASGGTSSASSVAGGSDSAPSSAKKAPLVPRCATGFSPSSKLRAEAAAAAAAKEAEEQRRIRAARRVPLVPRCASGHAPSSSVRANPALYAADSPLSPRSASDAVLDTATPTSALGAPRRVAVSGADNGGSKSAGRAKRVPRVALLAQEKAAAKVRERELAREKHVEGAADARKASLERGATAPVSGVFARLVTTPTESMRRRQAAAGASNAADDKTSSPSSPSGKRGGGGGGGGGGGSGVFDRLASRTTESERRRQERDGPSSTSSSAMKRSTKTSPAIFDRLTDPKLYTGAHKHRFDESGKGKGKQGRDAVEGEFLESFREEVHKPSVAKKEARTPVKAGAKYEASPIYDRLTDPKLYTGSHKARFDEEGKGKGKKGRDEGVKEEFLETFRADVHKPSVVPKKELKTYESTYKSSPIFDKLTDPKLYTGSHKERFDESGKGKGKKGREGIKGDFLETFREDVHKPSVAPKKELKTFESKYESSPIFDKLTDPKLFTGSHKERFDEQGKGKGKAGREGVRGEFLESFREDVHKPSVAPKKELSTHESRYEPAPIFDRLTDPKLFTGSHKQRFDADGKGKGVAGRDRVRTDTDFLSDSPQAKSATKEVASKAAVDEKTPLYERLHSTHTEASEAKKDLV